MCPTAVCVVCYHKTLGAPTSAIGRTVNVNKLSSPNPIHVQIMMIQPPNLLPQVRPLLTTSLCFS